MATISEDSARESKSLHAMSRPHFPALDQQIHGHPLIYFDNAATTQKPRQVIEVIKHFYEHNNANVHRGLHELSNRATTTYESARSRVANFINAPSPDNIVFTRGTTEAINLVANAWGNAFVHRGDTILLTEMEHHANLVPWQMLAERTGCRLVMTPVIGDDSRLDQNAFCELLSQKPKLAAFTHVSNTLGIINPISQMCEQARRQGVVTLVDAAQSIGHMPLDVQEIDCDFLVFSGHKMCAPTGIGVLYGRFDLLEQMPPWHGGGEMITRVYFDHSEFKQPPHRFEAGTPPIAETAGLFEAMNYLDKIGREHIFKNDQSHAEYALSRLIELPGIRILGPKSGRCGLVTFALQDIHAHDVVAFADRYGIALRGGHHCNQPLMRKLGLSSTVRASFYFYNTLQEIDRMIEVLKETCAFFTHER